MNEDNNHFTKLSEISIIIETLVGKLLNIKIMKFANKFFFLWFISLSHMGWSSSCLKARTKMLPLLSGSLPPVDFGFFTMILLRHEVIP